MNKKSTPSDVYYNFCTFGEKRKKRKKLRRIEHKKITSIKKKVERNEKKKFFMYIRFFEGKNMKEFYSIVFFALNETLLKKV